jgi:hypothetical protein
MTRHLCWLLAAGSWLLTTTACVKLHAKNTPEGPPLEMPAPPPRVVDSPDTEPPPPVSLPEEPARHPTTGTKRSVPPPTPRPEPPKPEPPKTDQPPPQSSDPAKPPEEPAKPATTLQTIPAGAEVEVERGIRVQLNRASSDLGRVDYRALNNEARTQYDTAKGLVRQAEDALKAKNLVFARSLADKAAALAAQLAGK